ncbi:hypothetical protein EVAR_62469_1 [Eumeta japonica]|uniref:Uncharacterized protein n=1 Tax=Eumeta variegata TaxID=151549 RepID=A0A4C1ZKX9_EUMVA|nr:hypothetical protein EVAR_62469_1 [Eumeta japonica]
MHSKQIHIQVDLAHSSECQTAGRPPLAEADINTPEPNFSTRRSADEKSAACPWKSTGRARGTFLGRDGPRARGAGAPPALRPAFANQHRRHLAHVSYFTP